MRIENLRREQTGETVRVLATVIWEDNDRPPFDLYFTSSEAFSSDLTGDPHAHLVAATVPAMQCGEQRILINEKICPELLEGLQVNMLWLQNWSEGHLRPVKIECIKDSGTPVTNPRRSAGSFLSGGVDSLATLRANRLNYALDHPASIRDCVIVHGFDIGGVADVGLEEEFFNRSLSALKDIADDAQVNLIPIASNVRLLNDDVSFWMHSFHGAALASVAHTLRKRLNRMYIGSSFNIPLPPSWGSHPLLDANYGDSTLQIKHAGLNFTRLGKIRLIADWDVALRNLRVCTMNPGSGLNCGICEKCIRTMLELLVVGKLEVAESFPVRRVDADLLDALHIRAGYQVAWYEELVGPLSALGHHQLVKVIDAKLADYRKQLAWEEEQDWKGVVKRFDRRYFAGRLFKSWKTLRPHLLRPSQSEI